MTRGNPIWIYAQALPTIPESSRATLGFTEQALPRFANADQARRCAEELIALLGRYGIKTEVRQDAGAISPRGDEQAKIRGAAAWINAEAAATVTEYGGVTLGFAPDALPIFASADEARRCAEELIALLQRYGIKANFRQD